jgi:hypothetical protein
VQALPANTRALDLTQYALPAGNYSLFVKARGQPSVFNHLSAAVPFTVYSTLNVTSPSSNAVVSSPVTFQASASSPVGVKSIALNIDGRIVYTSHASTLSTVLPLASGMHKYLYVVTDTLGRSTKEGGSITVQ